MLTLVRRAGRRLLLNELLSEAANATSAALFAFILLLLIGTQVLSWWWLVSIPLAAAAAGLYRLRKRLPSPYSVAQIVDRRTGLSDTLSTAIYFSRPGMVPKGLEEMCRLQSERAGRLAGSVDARRAIPYVMPRSAYLVAALALVAFSLFALRYGLNRRLDLRPPLARILEQAFGFESKPELARNFQKKLPPEAQPRQDDSAETPQDQAGSGDRQDDSADVAPDANQAQPASGDQKKTADSRKQGDEGDKADSGDQDGPGEERDANDGDNAGSNQSGKNKQDQKQDAGSKQDGNNPGENSSLMSKVKDAMQNLLSRMKPQPGSQQQSSMDQKGNQGKGQQSGSKQQASRDGQPQSGGQQSDSQDGQTSEQAQNGQDPQGKGTGKSDTPQASKQPGSGIGSQDGDKNIKQAEQLAAMGKISEILGKRSATISGESTVEVQNTSQQLHTPYARRDVQHSQGGAEINRDEVPVALQAFVAQYFEQIRKQAPPKK